MTEHHRTQRWLIVGRVQGVGYRDWMCRAAGALGVAGWVRNLGTGEVEALVRAPGDVLDRLREACRSGPSAAIVAEIRERDVAEGTDSVGFERRPDATGR
ncbi:acylphosphatase [Rhizosaccharibacter radicis]|uniref:acylphosphatase n=1 Tax=Rhizosaccharibacter radicis TaxID=2782605 RepID=A0ABT1VYP6_9PROT|nr:acylphosphatase [Acetobacteraceae bacterium KSS12]